MAKHTLNELGNMSREELITIILSMQGQLDALNENIEKLIEQVRLANSYRFGRHTETLKKLYRSIPCPWSSWMPSMGKAAGAGCRMKSIKDCGTSRNPGQWKSIPLRCMSGQMATIRMNL